MFKMTKSNFVYEMLMNLIVAIGLMAMAWIGFQVSFVFGIIMVIMETAMFTLKMVLDVEKYFCDKEES